MIWEVQGSLQSNSSPTTTCFYPEPPCEVSPKPKFNWESDWPTITLWALWQLLPSPRPTLSLFRYYFICVQTKAYSTQDWQHQGALHQTPSSVSHGFEHRLHNLCTMHNFACAHMVDTNVSLPCKSTPDASSDCSLPCSPMMSVLLWNNRQAYNGHLR